MHHIFAIFHQHLCLIIVKTYSICSTHVTCVQGIRAVSGFIPEGVTQAQVVDYKSQAMSIIQEYLISQDVGETSFKFIYGYKTCLVSLPAYATPRWCSLLCCVPKICTLLNPSFIYSRSIWPCFTDDRCVCHVVVLIHVNVRWFVCNHFFVVFLSTCWQGRI